MWVKKGGKKTKRIGSSYVRPCKLHVIIITCCNLFTTSLCGNMSHKCAWPLFLRCPSPMNHHQSVQASNSGVWDDYMYMYIYI